MKGSSGDAGNWKVRAFYIFMLWLEPHIKHWKGLILGETYEYKVCLWGFYKIPQNVWVFLSLFYSLMNIYNKALHLAKERVPPLLSRSRNPEKPPSSKI